MTCVAETYASLRFVGDALDPDEISRLLRTAPTFAIRKGEPRKGKSSSAWPASSGVWYLDAAARDPGDIDAQVRELFGQVSADLEVWLELTRRFRCDIFCGLYLNDTNEGIELAPETLGLIAARGVVLGLDIYAPREPAQG